MSKVASSTTSKTTEKAGMTQEVVAVIVGAISAMGYSENQIASIRPAINRNWRLIARMRSQF